MAIVVFKPTAFRTRYREFAAMDDELLNDFFAEATDIVNNTDSSIIRDVELRRRLLWYLVAHKAALESSEGMVGRISSATEGSVSVSSEFIAPKTGTAAWYFQTKYGADYWTASAKFRNFRYVPKKHICEG